MQGDCLWTKTSSGTDRCFCGGKQGKCPAGLEDAGGHQQRGRPTPAGRTFGPGPRKALEAALDIAAGMGLDAHNCEGYIGYADLPGASPTQIATITHLDVVPEGNGWTGSRLIWCAATAMSWDAAWPTTKAPLY